jgi:hypothetical protein
MYEAAVDQLPGEGTPLFLLDIEGTGGTSAPGE